MARHILHIMNCKSIMTSKQHPVLHQRLVVKLTLQTQDSFIQIMSHITFSSICLDWFTPESVHTVTFSCETSHTTARIWSEGGVPFPRWEASNQGLNPCKQYSALDVETIDKSYILRQFSVASCLQSVQYAMNLFDLDIKITCVEIKTKVGIYIVNFFMQYFRTQHVSKYCMKK